MYRAQNIQTSVVLLVLTLSSAPFEIMKKRRAVIDIVLRKDCKPQLLLILHH